MGSAAFRRALKWGRGRPPCPAVSTWKRRNLGLAQAKEWREGTGGAAVRRTERGAPPTTRGHRCPRSRSAAPTHRLGTLRLSARIWAVPTALRPRMRGSEPTPVPQADRGRPRQRWDAELGGRSPPPSRSPAGGGADGSGTRSWGSQPGGGARRFAFLGGGFHRCRRFRPPRRCAALRPAPLLPWSGAHRRLRPPLFSPLLSLLFLLGYFFSSLFPTFPPFSTRELPALFPAAAVGRSELRGSRRPQRPQRRSAPRNPLLSSFFNAPFCLFSARFRLPRPHLHPTAPKRRIAPVSPRSTPERGLKAPRLPPGRFPRQKGRPPPKIAPRGVPRPAPLLAARRGGPAVPAAPPPPPRPGSVRLRSAPFGSAPRGAPRGGSNNEKRDGASRRFLFYTYVPIYKQMYIKPFGFRLVS